MSGSATDDIGVTRISWTNDRGGAGEVTPSSPWTIAGIALQAGDNRIVVTAEDAAGNTGSDTLTVTYAPADTTSLTGLVDSSRINRAGANAIYIYLGAVTPDDMGGAGANPLVLAAVVQDVGACTWRYQLDGLAPGEYTIAFTNQAANDNPAADDAITFVGVTGVSVQAGAMTTKNFDATTTWRVGPTRQYKKPSEVSGLVGNGHVVEIDSGTYLGDVAIWRANNLTLRGVGGRAHLNANGANYGGKGTWVIAGANTAVENIEFSNSTVPDQNGAGIRQDGPGLTVCNGYFHDNENGILGGTGGDILIEYSEFSRNGYGDGYSHNIYISSGVNRFIFRYSYSHHAKRGHNIKTRARENHILYSRVMDETTGNSSYAIDVPDCGVTYIIGSAIQQGLSSDNSTIIAYGAEACNNGNQQLYLSSNTVVNDRGSGSFLFARSGTVIGARNNLFVGNGSIPASIDLLTQNLRTTTPAFVGQSSYDYHLTAASPKDNGITPGSANGIDLSPMAQYVHPLSFETRPLDARLDMGAFEYVP